MAPVHAVADAPAPQAHPRPGLIDLESLVAEVGASYPLLAYTALADEEQGEADAIDSLILAGLVAP